MSGGLAATGGMPQTGRILTPDDWSRPWRVWWSLWLLAVPFYALGLTMLTWGEVPPSGGLIAPVLTVFAILWSRYRHQPTIWVTTLVALPIITAAFAALGGLTWWQAAWVGLSLPVVSAVMMAIYGVLMKGIRWTPMEPGDLFRNLLAGVPIMSLAVFTGFMPGSHPFSLDEYNLIYAVRFISNGALSCMTAPILWWLPGKWEHLRRDLLWLAVLIPVAALGGQTWLRQGEITPLTMLLFVPPLVAGWSLSVRGAAVYGFVVPIIGIATAVSSLSDPSARDTVQFQILIELIFGLGSFICIMTALFRYRAELLTASLVQARRQSESRAATLDAIFDSLSEGLMLFDAEGQLVTRNDRAIELFGAEPSGTFEEWTELIGLRNEQGERFGIEESLVHQVLNSHTRTVTCQRHLDGRVMWLSVTLRPLGEAGDDFGLVVVRDITGERLRADELKSFAGVVAHDLRTPLTGLEGWLEVLEEELDGEAPPTVNRAVEAAVGGAQRLREGLDSWLDFTIGRDAALARETVVVADVVRDALAEAGAWAAGAEVTIEATDHVHADPVVLRRVFANVLGNAVKYASPERRPEIVVRSRPHPERAGFLLIEVQDNGRGIPAGEEQRIFEEFHRARAHADQVAGNGLGLSVTRRGVERHGGTITARRNIDGPGSTFEISLPIAVR